jgi:cobyrinic acid a,c-diamide synthase
MEDKSLPEGVQGLYLGGGFPEIWAQQLAENHRALQAVRSAIASGMPTYSECGGLMYLCKEIIDFGGKSWSMVGALPTTAIMSNKLTLGYRQATGLKDSLVLKTGEILRGHEFHRSKLTSHPEQPLLSSKGVHPSSVEAPEGWQIKQVYASYVHLHFGGYQKIAQRFLQHCLDFFPRVSYPRQ